MRRCLLFPLLLLALHAVAVEPPRTEVRGIWLTTAYALDWPHNLATSDKGRDAQKQELCTLLDRLQDANFNTVFFQVRLRGDVIYPSSIERFSSVLTGKEGVSPGYDPLAFAVDECHKRGLECHAWFVTFPLGSDRLVKNQGKYSVVKLRSSLCKHYNGEWFLDPGASGTADYILSLVKEIVGKYDIDGIHFDYIRYPEDAKSFPDKQQYKKSGGQSQIDNWRRDNINNLVYRVYDTVKGMKPWVQVSSSPLGKYQRIPEVPNAGWTAYESVYQDAVKWMKNGKQDMVVPMMYYLNSNFFPFVNNWVQNSNGRFVVPGLGAYRMLKDEGGWTLNNVTDQIDYSRANGAVGCNFFRGEQVINNVNGLYDVLKNNYYKYPALLPPLTWINNSIPAKPTDLSVEHVGDNLKITWKKPEGENQQLIYTVYFSLKGDPSIQSAQNILMSGIRGTELYLPVGNVEQGYCFTVTAMNRCHIESQPSNETYYYLSRYIK